MRIDKFQELLNLVDHAVSHSELKNGTLVSVVHVRIPIPGGMSHLFPLERRMVVEVNRVNEESTASAILTRTLEYILEHAETVGEPVFQENEDGEVAQVGNTQIFIDRKRIRFPIVKEENNHLFLDCVTE